MVKQKRSDERLHPLDRLETLDKTKERLKGFKEGMKEEPREINKHTQGYLVNMFRDFDIENQQEILDFCERYYDRSVEVGSGINSVMTLDERYLRYDQAINPIVLDNKRRYFLLKCESIYVKKGGTIAEFYKKLNIPKREVNRYFSGELTLSNTQFREIGKLLGKSTKTLLKLERSGYIEGLKKGIYLLEYIYENGFEEDIRKKFGKDMVAYRKKMGMMIKELADKMGVSASHLGSIERGEKFLGKKTLDSWVSVMGDNVTSAWVEQYLIATNNCLVFKKYFKDESVQVNTSSEVWETLRMFEKELTKINLESVLERVQSSKDLEARGYELQEKYLIMLIEGMDEKLKGSMLNHIEYLYDTWAEH